MWVIVDLSTDVIVNLCVWDGGPSWSPPEGHAAYQYIEGADIGCLWNNGNPIPQE